MATRIELSHDLTDRLRSRTAGQRRRASAGLIGLGIVLVVVAAALAGALAVRPEARQLEPVLAMVILGAVGLWMIGVGATRRRRLDGLPAEAGVLVGAPYAFEITDSTLEFPSRLDHDAESWTLRGTHAEVRRVAGQPTLVLRHEGFATRRFFSFVLVEAPDAVLAAVERARADDARRDG